MRLSEIFDVFWWVIFATVVTGLGWWINRHMKFDSTNQPVVASSRALVFLMSLVFGAVLVILVIEVIVVAAH